MYALVTCNRCCKNSNADQDRSGKSILAPFCICPQPISRQCFSTRLLKAIFSCSLVHTGDVSCSFARSLLTCSSCRLFNRVLQKPQPNQAWHDCHEGDITHVRLNAISTSMVVTTHCTRQEPPIAIELDIGRCQGLDPSMGFKLTAMTLAPVHIDPILSMRTSPLLSFCTLPCFSPPCMGTTYC